MKFGGQNYPSLKYLRVKKKINMKPESNPSSVPTVMDMVSSTRLLKALYDIGIDLSGLVNQIINVEAGELRKIKNVGKSTINVFKDLKEKVLSGLIEDFKVTQNDG
jgi:hypothetical protein